MTHHFTHRPFSVITDMPVMNRWLADRGMPKGNPNFLPPTGFLIYNGSTPVCLGFMIKCDNNTAINTDLIACPRVNDSLRNDAVEYLRQVLYKEAQDLKMQFVTVFTSIPAHAERLKSLGYAEIDKNLTQMGRFLWL